MRTPRTPSLFVALAIAACSPAPVAPAPIPEGAAAGAATGGNPEQSRFGVTPGATPTPRPATPVPATPAPVAAAPVATPVATPVPTPVPTPLAPVPLAQAPWDPSRAGARMVAFASSRYETGQGRFDVYLYDPTTATVYAIPAANTAGDEVHPRLSSDGHWLVFASNFRGNFDVLRYDMQNQILDPLATMNTMDDEVWPSIDDAGDRVAYMSSPTSGGQQQIKIYDKVKDEATTPTSLSAMQAVPHTPQISGDGKWIVFSATDAKGADVYLHEVGGASVLNPPFINTASDEVDPWLSPDGLRVLFASNRNGSFDLFEADMASGLTKELDKANSSGNDRSPRYMGPEGKDILFKSDRTVYQDQVQLYHPLTSIVDTLPIQHEPTEDEVLGTAYTVQPLGQGGDTGGVAVDDGFFGFGDLHRRGGQVFGRRGL